MLAQTTSTMKRGAVKIWVEMSQRFHSLPREGGDAGRVGEANVVGDCDCLDWGSRGDDDGLAWGLW